MPSKIKLLAAISAIFLGIASVGAAIAQTTAPLGPGSGGGPGGGGGGGSGTVSPATIGQVAVYSGSTTVSGYAGLTYSDTATTGLQVVSHSFGLSGDISAAAWTTSGIRYKNVAATLTDTSSSGTVATAYTDVWGGNTIAASSATTYTNYYGAYFKVPVVGTNVTFTNSWALGADSIGIASAGGLGWNSDTFLTRHTAANIQFGAANVNGAPIAQTLSFQGALAASAMDQASANATIIGSLGTGAGTNGDIIFQTGVKTSTGKAQATPTTALTIKGETLAVTTGGGFISGGNIQSTNNIIAGANQFIYWSGSASYMDEPATGVWRWSNASNSGIRLDRTAGDGTVTFLNYAGNTNATIVAGNGTFTTLANTATTSAVCYNTGTGVLTYDGTIGTCTTSDERLKTFDAPMRDALSSLVAISGNAHFGYFHWIDGNGDPKIGMGAQTVARYFPELVEIGSDGRYSLDYGKLTVPIIAALAQLNSRLELLEARH